MSKDKKTSQTKAKRTVIRGKKSITKKAKGTNNSKGSNSAAKIVKGTIGKGTKSVAKKVKGIISKGEKSILKNGKGTSNDKKPTLKLYQRLHKDFLSPFLGEVKKVPSSSDGFYQVLYEDGDTEDMSTAEVAKGVEYFFQVQISRKREEEKSKGFPSKVILHEDGEEEEFSPEQLIAGAGSSSLNEEDGKEQISYKKGTKVLKDFPMPYNEKSKSSEITMTPYIGKITRGINEKNRYYRILYEDGDAEDMSAEEVKKCVKYFIESEKKKEPQPQKKKEAQNEKKDERKDEMKQTTTKAGEEGSIRQEIYLKGTKVMKDFHRSFEGEIIRVPKSNAPNAKYRVKFFDGDIEDITAKALEIMVEEYETLKKERKEFIPEKIGADVKGRKASVKSSTEVEDVDVPVEASADLRDGKVPSEPPTNQKDEKKSDDDVPLRKRFEIDPEDMVL